MQTLEIFNSRLKFVFFLILCLIFTGIGVMILVREPDQAPMAWVTIFLFGLCSLAAIKPLLDRRPRIILSSEGIFDRTLKVGVIAWADVRSVRITSIRGNQCVEFDLADDEKYMARMTGAARKMAVANRALGFAAVSLNPAGMTVDGKALLALLNQHLPTKV